MNIIYINNKGKKLLDNKDLFLSKKAKFTFSGYSHSQLLRLKNHCKYINKYPNTGKILEILKTTYDRGKIDFDWVKDYFGGQVAETICEGKAKLLNSYDIHGLFYILNDIVDYLKYIRPHIIDFMTVRDFNCKKIENDDIKKIIFGCEVDFYELSKNFFGIYKRNLENTINITDSIFTRDGNLKQNNSFEPGNRYPDYILTLDETAYISAKKEFNDLWNWKINRNKSRSILEDKIGYDAKHAAMLYKLLNNGIEILKTKEYNPRLKNPLLQEVLDIKAGLWSYEKLIEKCEKLEKDLEVAYTESELQNSVDIKKINELLLDLSK